MHFRYHITRTNLINDRLNVTSASIESTIDNSLRTGIAIDSQANIEKYIKDAKGKESIIDNIYVLSNKNWTLIPAFKTAERDLPASIIRTASQRMKSAKGISWSFADEENNEKKNFFGLTVKGPTGAEVGVIIVSCKQSVVGDQEKQEIYALYKRMAFAILICILISILAGYHSTYRITLAINTINQSITHIRNKNLLFDLSNIDDPLLRGNYRKVLKHLTTILTNLDFIEGLLKSAEKEERHEKN
jgi:hypothetical protein